MAKIFITACKDECELGHFQKLIADCGGQEFDRYMIYEEIEDKNAPFSIGDTIVCWYFDNEEQAIDTKLADKTHDLSDLMAQNILWVGAQRNLVAYGLDYDKYGDGLGQNVVETAYDMGSIERDTEFVNAMLNSAKRIMESA